MDDFLVKGLRDLPVYFHKVYNGFLNEFIDCSVVKMLYHNNGIHMASLLYGFSNAFVGHHVARKLYYNIDKHMAYLQYEFSYDSVVYSMLFQTGFVCKNFVTI